MAGGVRIPSPDWLPPEYREQANRQLGIAQPKAHKRPKYGNRKTVVDGIVFDSKKESRHYELLKLQLKAGEIRGFSRQAKFDLPGGVVYVCDFIVWTKDGAVEVRDVKGVCTKEYRIKARLMRSEHGIEVLLI